jgi:tRNA G18 (ribose-2'-O)-methylase SpoU
VPNLDNPALDEDLLANGDNRNVVDKYRYWKHADIVADLDTKRHAYHIAIENYQHDFNIGAIVRNANAFLAAGVHIVGRRQWNRRGAMVTDRYQHIHNHPNVAVFANWAKAENLTVVGIDNIEGSKPIDRVKLPEKCVLLFGQEGPGLSPEAQKICEVICEIPQFGSTRSINVGVASGIAMFAWIQQHIR